MRPIFPVAGILALALVARIAAALTAGGVWRDEANDIFLCRDAASWSAVLTALRSEGSPPLRFAAECALHRLSPDSLWPARAYVVGMGTLAVFLVMAMGARVAGPRAALMAGLLTATSPFFIRYSVELRGYAQLQAAAGAYGLALLGLVARPTWPWIALSGVAGGILCLTHYFGLLQVTAATVWLLAMPGERGSRPAALASAAIAAAVFLPAAPLLVSQSGPDLRPWTVANHNIVDAVQVLKLPVGTAGWLVLAGLCLVGVRSRHTSGSIGKAGVPLLAATALGGTMLAWGLQFVERLNLRQEPQYLVGLAVWLMPVVGVGIAAMADSLGRSERSRARWPLPATLGLCLALQAANAQTWLRPRSPMRDIARRVASSSRPTDAIVIVPAAHAATFNFWYEGPLEEWAPPFHHRVRAVPWSGLLGRMQHAAATPGLHPDLARVLQSGRRLWVVVGGSTAAAPALQVEETAAWPTPYHEADAGIRRAIWRMISTEGVVDRVWSTTPAMYWEPADLLLVSPKGNH
jgi:hypothetical protein